METTLDTQEEVENEIRQHEASPVCSIWLSFCGWFHLKMEKMFTVTSGKIASHPKLTILVGLLIVGSLSIGFIWFNFEKRTVKIFIPQGSQAMKDLEKADKYFSLKIRQETIIIIPQDGKKLLSAPCFKNALKIHNAVIRLPSYSNLCATLSPTGEKENVLPKCMFLSPLELFNFDENMFFNISSKIKEETVCPSSFMMRNGHSSCQNINRMFGNEEHRISNFSEIKAMRLIYYLQDTDTYYSKAISWEADFLNVLSSLQKNMTCARLFFGAERSLDDAIDDSSSSDIRYFALTFTVMINFANLMLGKMFRNPLTGHSLLGMGGVICVGLGIVAGFGLSMMSQTPFVKIVGILPFLVVGIAIDDMFIILDDLDRNPRDITIKETVTNVMSRTGPTVTMTTITDLVAFAISTSSQFPSIQYFCTYAALTITFAYLLIVTVFVALMTLDVKRIKANRRNCLPLCLAPNPKDGEAPWDEPRQSVSSRLMEKWGELLMKPYSKVLVVLLSLGLLGAGIYGTLNTSESFNRSLLVRDGTPYKKFIMQKEKYFDNSLEFSVIVDEPLDYSTRDSQDAIHKLGNIIRANKYCKSQKSSWIDEFKKYCYKRNLTTVGKPFMDNLKLFLKDPVHSSFVRDVVFSMDKKRIAASRILGYIKGTDSSVFLKDAMLALRKDFTAKSSIKVYPIANSFIFLEQYAIILTETIRNLAIASLAILIITSPFLVDFIIIVMVSFSFVSLVFELFGLMVIWGVSLNSISMINLVMAIGFSVDYSAHIALCFLKSKEKTAEKRVVDSLRSVGASVALGGTSTLLGIALTSLSDSEIFRIFFKMFFGMVILGLLHGLLFLPVYLALFGRWSKHFHNIPVVMATKYHVKDIDKRKGNYNQGSIDAQKRESGGNLCSDINYINCSDIQDEGNESVTTNF